MTIQEKQTQLSDLGLLAALLHKMIDNGDDAVVAGTKRDIVLLSELALVVCDMAESYQHGVPLSPASMHILVSLKADHAIFRASQVA